ncbi:hypothetical protein G5C51_27490 [Streptomyces sp. A7024]|uniref:Uncharacterized protein n=1 Tax=Streptomyces coryli TaxID=1128680 RepID=A0A6G4U6L1_9ACTN|nr:hypothetical protein [Streptomyces coryli]NGN67632.1 hypothetical protein [Streptomyces coryli]
MSAAIAVVLAVAGTWFARLQPIQQGSTWMKPMSSGDAWELENSALTLGAGHSHNILVRQEPRAEITMRLTLRNDSSLDLKVIDPEPALAAKRAQSPVAIWQPQSLRFSADIFSDKPAGKLTPPFTLAPGEEMRVEFTSTIGDPDRRFQRNSDGVATLSGIEVPLRFSWFGIPRTQNVPLDVQIAISPHAEDYLKPKADKINTPAR